MSSDSVSDNEVQLEFDFTSERSLSPATNQVWTATNLEWTGSSSSSISIDDLLQFCSSYSPCDARICQCEINLLMREGCKCGGT